MLVVPVGILLGVEVLIAVLLFTPVVPIRGLGLLVVGALKSSPANAVAKTLLGSLVVVLVFSITAIHNLHRLVSKEAPILGGGVSPGKLTVLSDTLECLLIGFSILLAVFIERLHAHMKEGDRLKINLETLKKQAKGLEAEYSRLHKEHSDSGKGDTKDGESKSKSKSETIPSSLKNDDTVSELEAEIEKLNDEIESLKKEIQKSEANSRALKKQSEGFQIEYDRMLSENEDLRAQLSAFDRSYANSYEKKKS